MSAADKKRQAQKKWAEDYRDRSTQFCCTMFLGRGVYDRRFANTIGGARRIRSRMLDEYAGQNFGRGVLIYALTPDNCNVLVE